MSPVRFVKVPLSGAHESPSIEPSISIVAFKLELELVVA